MKPVVKYCVYSDILLRVPIYVTKRFYFYENPVNHKICQIAIRRPVKGLGLEECNGRHQHQGGIY